MDRQRAMAVRCAEAVRAGVAAAQDDDAFPGREDLVRDGVARDDLVLLRQELHREVDAGELAARDGEVARLRGAARQHDRVELAAELVGLERHAHVDARLERHAFGRHLRHAAVDQVLLHLEVGNAVAE
jgi:hypothetical protein